MFAARNNKRLRTGSTMIALVLVASGKSRAGTKVEVCVTGSKRRMRTPLKRSNTGAPDPAGQKS